MIQAKWKRCKVTKHLKSVKQIFGNIFVAVQNDMLFPHPNIKFAVDFNGCLPVEDIKAQDGVATGRLPSAGVLGSIAY